ncbi:MAG: TolC family protein [Chitinophagales bacterium]|nr:TolC family protein [Chitinophagales bacterium]
MSKTTIKLGMGMLLSTLLFTGCVPTMVQRAENRTVPQGYSNTSNTDTVNTGMLKWNQFFTDPYLIALIDTALKNNQELNITLQEINIAKNEVQARKGEYLPFVGIGAGAGVDKPSRFTSRGASEFSSVFDEEGTHLPDPLQDYQVGVYASWELDIWKKLRNAKKSATYSYLASVEGKNLMVTHLVAEIANSYFELMALDNQLQILQTNIGIQQNALQIVKMEKEAAKVTELAVRRFEAEVLKNQSTQYELKQQIIETENRINFLVGRFPQPILRNSDNFINLVPDSLSTGVPAQLLDNRPDIKQADLNLSAAKLDVKVAKADFYPSLRITAGFGIQGFNFAKFIKAPESLLFNIAGDLVAPLVNRNALKAKYYSANAKQSQAVFNYEKTLLGAYISVANQVSLISNLQQKYALKQQQVDALNQSITISTNLFRSARADYMEVLLTQRDALESKMEQMEIKLQQMNAMVHMYQELGGGWR